MCNNGWTVFLITIFTLGLFWVVLHIMSVVSVYPGTLRYQDLPLKSSALTIHDTGAGACGRPLFIYYHGNGHCVSDMSWFSQHVWLWFNFNTVAMEYPGYCRRHFWHEWTLPSQDTILKEGHDLINMFRRECPHTDIILYGSSLGSAVVLQLASNTTVNKLRVVAENPFQSVARIAGIRLPYFDNWQAPRRAHVPTLLLFSEKDELFNHQDYFRSYYADRASFYVLSGSLHGHAASHPDTKIQLTEFFKDLK